MGNVNSFSGTSIQHTFDELKDFDWGELSDFDSIGVWPGPVKIILAVVVFCLCIGGGYWFHIKNLEEELASAAEQEVTLRSDLETRAVLAASLNEYRQQMRDMEESFGALLRQLPGETEVPGLIDDIYFTGDGSGSEIISLALAEEKIREFYIELPIDIEMMGSFHDFGTFVSGVASLSRIVTLHDFSISIGANRSRLEMNINAKTYRYNDLDE